MENLKKVLKLENLADFGSQLDPEIDSDGKYQCDKCEKQHIQVHFLSQHEGYKIDCSFCGKTFTNVSNLSRHKKNAHSIV